MEKENRPRNERENKENQKKQVPPAADDTNRKGNDSNSEKE